MHVLDDAELSPRVASFLAQRGRRSPSTPPERIRAGARTVGADGPSAASPELVTALLEFEERFGGLTYRINPRGGNPQEYGLDGESTLTLTEVGWSFPGILDGDWTSPVEVLVDGRTAMSLGGAPPRIIDRSLEQRLEKHALLAEVRDWPHSTFMLTLPHGADPRALVPDLAVDPVPEAGGPADRWWAAQHSAVQLTLHSWWTNADVWLLRLFGEARHHQALGDFRIPLPRLDPALDHLADDGHHEGPNPGPAPRIVRPRPAHWCELCGHALPADPDCQPGLEDHPA